MKVKELRTKTRDELKVHMLDLLKEQFNLRMQRGSGQAFRSSDIKRVRKEIAQTKTIMHELKMSISA